MDSLTTAGRLPLPPESAAVSRGPTLLFGGLTFKHERLIQAALESRGYPSEALPTPDVPAFQLGKEFGNNGQCNPTYFTVGNLVQHLQGLERDGLSKEQIKDRYVFLTAGACGPCRFGMYEAEYRLALRNSGFEDFRVIVLQQKQGYEQADVDMVLDLDRDLYLEIINAVLLGDLVNDVAYRLRPFEVEPGATDRALAESIEDLYRVALARRPPAERRGPVREFLERVPGVEERMRFIESWSDQLLAGAFDGALERTRARFDAVRVDRTRAKPIVKITGEFWAQTTEGDGNFNMFSFLEREGAQVLVEPVGTWLMYLLHQTQQKHRDRVGLPPRRADGTLSQPLPVLGRVASHVSVAKRIAVLKLAERVFSRQWGRYRSLLGDVPSELADQYHLQRIADPFYNTRAEGGEGHLEVAKNIYYANKGLCHMVLSLKPFGCMPSTQSDGVQSAVVNRYKDIIYLPIETSGEGEVNAHSRVQMSLGEARSRAREEMEEALAACRHSLDEIRAFADARPELTSGMYRVPKSPGMVSVAANYVLHVDALMGGASAERRSA